MGWLNQLEGQIVGLDTAPLIYFIEQREAYLQIVRDFFQAMSQGRFRVVTSTLTLTEVLVHPVRLNRVELIEAYRNIILEQENLVTLPVSTEIAEAAARLRAIQNLRTPDAIQIATASQAGAAAFLTNDARLSGVPDLEVLVLENLRCF